MNQPRENQYHLNQFSFLKPNALSNDMCSRQRHRSGCWAFIQFVRVTLSCWLHAESAEKDLDRVPNNYFTYFSTKTYVVGTQKNRLNETVLLNGDGSFEHPKRKFKLMGKKIFTLLCCYLNLC